MLFKVLSTFLVIQFFSFALWQSVQAWQGKTSIKPKPVPVIEQHEAAITDETTHEHVKFSARSEEKKFYNLSSDRKTEIVSVFNKLPASHTETLKNIILDYDPEAHRGLGGKGVIILRAVNMDPEEFVGVLVHEIGHTVDLGSLSETNKSKVSEFKDGKKSIYEGDPSLDFYRISWENDKTRRKSASNLDFVSGYALSDPFEDFSESYVYYVLHNREFKALAETNNDLLTKYDFFKYTVFNGEEFDTGLVESSEKLWRRPWDITVLSYNLQNFLNT